MKEKIISKKAEKGHSKLEEIDESLHKVCKSICKISYYDKKLKGITFGSGFFIKLFKDGKELLGLMTNYHVITKEIIESKTIINIKYKYEKELIQIKLDEKERCIKYNKDLDFVIIEIKQEDKIKDKYFLTPNLNDKNFINENIIIVQFPLAGKLSKSEGKIIRIENYELIHNADTKKGSSGSPIFSKGTTEVIGIHKSVLKTKEKKGIKFYSIFQLINSEKKEETFKNETTDIDTNDYKEREAYYFGDILDNKMNGEGILFDMNGNIIYKGDFVNNYYEGNGKLIYEDGEYYIGQFLKGERHGKGILNYKNDNIKYEGEFVNDKKEGNGKYIWEDGDYYIGQFKNGLKNGKGTLYSKNGKKKFEGDYINDKLEGNVKLFLENGDYFMQQYKNNLSYGKGTIYYSNGKIKYESA